VHSTFFKFKIYAFVTIRRQSSSRKMKKKKYKLAYLYGGFSTKKKEFIWRGGIMKKMIYRAKDGVFKISLYLEIVARYFLPMFRDKD
jgi:hypothetical protein